MNTGQVIQRLFDYGANILGRDEDGNQPVLYNAIENNDTEIINLLLEFGINYDDEGVIEHAIEYNNSQLIELFINRNDNTTSINETLLG
jgi:ankyrin repeat protein